MKALDDREALDSLWARSRSEAVLLFKHSTRCGVSSAARREIERLVETRPDLPIGVVEVPGRRDLAREVEARTGVAHQSPQVLVLRDGRVLWQASHWQITKPALEKALSPPPQSI